MSLLFTLYTLNSVGTMPSMVNLIRAESPMERVGRNTIESRRALIRIMAKRGYVYMSPFSVGRERKLLISPDGILCLNRYGYRARPIYMPSNFTTGK